LGNMDVEAAMLSILTEEAVVAVEDNGEDDTPCTSMYYARTQPVDNLHLLLYNHGRARRRHHFVSGCCKKAS
jgi:hypothetical protein